VRPQPDDPVQPAPGSTDQFVQISQWETLPGGIIIESASDPTTVNPSYAFPSSNSPGTYFQNGNLVNTGTMTVSGGGQANFASIQFDPTGAASFPNATNNATNVASVYILLTEGLMPSGGTAITYTHKNHNWVQAQVTLLTGRVQIVRP
jgi:hypothetical protein